MKMPVRLTSVFDFGPHEGRTVEEVIQADPRYIEKLLDDTSANFLLAPKAFSYFIEFVDLME